MIQGNTLFLRETMPVVQRLETAWRWTLRALDRTLPGALVKLADVAQFFGVEGE